MIWDAKCKMQYKNSLKMYEKGTKGLAIKKVRTFGW